MSEEKIKTVLVDSGFPEALTGETETRFVYNLLPVGKFYDKRYGELYVSDQMLQQMESNFGKEVDTAIWYRPEYSFSASGNSLRAGQNGRLVDPEQAP